MRFVKLNDAHLSAGRAKYRTYSQESMTRAYLAVKEEHLSIRRAAKSYGVPFQTLRDRVSGDVDPDCYGMGKQPLLSVEEEAKLVGHLKEMASLGYGYTRQEVADMATDYAIQVGKKQKDDPGFSMNWFYGFLGRWPELKVVKPRSLEVARAKAANVENVTNYFKELEKTLDKYNLKDKPHLIYNVDEKGLTINHRPPNVVAGSESHPQEVTSGKGQTITLLGCGNAVGNAVPPFFVFPGKRMNEDLMEGKSPGAVGTVSESGWSNSTIFLDWLKNHFSKYIPKDQKVMLMLDGHKSHVSLNVIEWAKNHNIILHLLPAHTSHLLQPLDVGCFGPLQKIYDNMCPKLMRSKECTITRYDACQLACKAYTTSVCANNLQTAFRKTGISPYDASIIDTLPLKPSEVFCNNDDSDVVDNVIDAGGDRPDGDGESEGEESENLLVQYVAERIVPENDSVVSEKGEGVVQEQDVECVGGEDFFEKKVAVVKRVKGERKKKKRNVLSGIVSGKTVTEDEVLEKVREHKRKHPGKGDCTEAETGVTGSKKRASSVKGKSVCSGRRRGKSSEEVGKCGGLEEESVGVKRRGSKKGRGKAKRAKPQKAGCSYVYVSGESESESENENEIEEKDKCCVCKLFTPVEVRKSVSLVFTKWAQCECGHWVHLGYCTKVRVCRRGDIFQCIHCE